MFTNLLYVSLKMWFSKKSIKLMAFDFDETTFLKDFYKFYSKISSRSEMNWKPQKGPQIMRI